MIKLALITTNYRGRLVVNIYKKWIREGEKILDVGCGSGIISHLLVKHFKSLVVGCDVLSYSIKDIPFVQITNQGKLPFSHKSFDTVTINDVLHHTSRENQERLIKEALRIGDKVLIFEDKPTIIGKLFDYIMNKIHAPAMDVPLTQRTVDEWNRLFKKWRLDVEYDAINTGTFYPFKHMAFCLKKPA